MTGLACFAFKPLPENINTKFNTVCTGVSAANIVAFNTGQFPETNLGTIIFHHKITRNVDASIVTSDLVTIKREVEMGSVIQNDVNNILIKYE